MSSLSPSPQPSPSGRGRTGCRCWSQTHRWIVECTGSGDRHREGVFLLPEGEGQDEGESVALSSTGCLDGSTRTTPLPTLNVEEPEFLRYLVPGISSLKIGFGRAVSRILSAPCGGENHLSQRPIPETCFAFTKRGAGRSWVSYLALHPMGFSVPRRLRFARWSLTPPFHPYHRLAPMAV